jgi:putative tryptophan/tyrosine transport system substrate-binding protein
VRRPIPPSLPDLIRQSILLRKKIDARGVSAFTRVFNALLPAHDCLTTHVVFLKRREFILALAGAAATSSLLWPLAARAQQSGPMPVIGYLGAASPTLGRSRALQQGLKEAGYVVGENVAIEYRWAEGEYDKLPALALELVRRPVSVLVTGGNAAALAAKAATTTIPTVFILTEDPVNLGLVASVPKPGGNATGINVVSGELTAKRLELLHELIPTAARVSVLVNPADPTAMETTLRDLEPAARAIGLKIQVLKITTSQEIHAAFAAMVGERSEALFLGSDPFFTSRRVQLATLSARHGIPLASQAREIAEAGGLMSYGANIADGFRQAGVYTGRILKGAKPADLPVVQSSKFELVINAETARMLGLTVPDKLLVAADEVIE